MNITVIIPIYNEYPHLNEMLNSLINQSIIPNRVILVNDNSTDKSQEIIDHYVHTYPYISSVTNHSEASHIPGAKVVNAFYKGLESTSFDCDLIGKFDGDIILPSNYFEKIIALFNSNPQIGIAGGNLYINRSDAWVFEAISKKTKVRGPIKLYRKKCFQDIGGLKKSIGWDTVDELLAQYHGWKIATDTTIHVKHLKPTGANYSKSSKLKQGQAFKKMRYGLIITLIASAKLAAKKKSLLFFTHCLQGFFSVKNDYLVTREEGKFIRRLRWKNILNKFS